MGRGGVMTLIPTLRYLWKCKINFFPPFFFFFFFLISLSVPIWANLACISLGIVNSCHNRSPPRWQSMGSDKLGWTPRLDNCPWDSHTENYGAAAPSLAFWRRRGKKLIGWIKDMSQVRRVRRMVVLSFTWRRHPFFLNSPNPTFFFLVSDLFIKEIFNSVSLES